MHRLDTELNQGFVFLAVPHFTPMDAKFIQSDLFMPTYKTHNDSLN